MARLAPEAKTAWARFTELNRSSLPGLKGMAIPTHHISLLRAPWRSVSSFGP